MVQSYTKKFKPISYCIAGSLVGGKFGKFGKSSMIHQTKTIQINNPLANVLICQTIFYQMLKKSQFAKLYPTKVSRYTV